MKREPAVTFRGALRILGHYDRPWVDRLDKLLGGVILGAGIATATQAAVFGWVDQKNEATGLLRTALDTVSNRLLKTGGLARHELVIAAHTTIVLSAFWEILLERMGPALRAVDLTAREKVRLGTGMWQHSGEPLVRHLFEAEVPAPSAVRGFEENVPAVRAWAVARAVAVRAFLLDLDQHPTPMDGEFHDAVAIHYRSDYLALATKVPEFKVWADLGEHAATRAALSRLETLLTPTAQKRPQPQLRSQLREINRAELSQPIIDADIDGYGIDAVFPMVQEIFVDPGYFVRSAENEDRNSVEEPVAEPEADRPGDDLDVVFARHFSTPDATRLPLLVLGHPGAGKSLLTKVLAARLPEPSYTVVRVPLRRVSADASVVEQIQQGLRLATNDTVTWPELAKECDDTIRVVLLDGLDELLQATSHDRGGYLADVMEFQRIEAALGRPVAVVVTSRTLVADRVRVPRGTPVVELSAFDDAQIGEWITTWNAANPNLRPMTPELAATHRDLAQQPLLLLMLTLYFTDPTVELSGDELSTAELYKRLLDTYAQREVTKQAGRVLPDEEQSEAVRAQLTRLSVAALGMFNRGRFSITEAELSADLAALGEPVPVGRRLLGEFYFVHAAEAGGGDERRYEFLHATFVEYLVATRVVEILEEVAEGAFGRRRFHEPDDELLFALMSHQPLAIQRPALDFVDKQLAALDSADRADITKTLDLLIPAYASRPAATKYLGYRPTLANTVRGLAAYSANLVLVRLLADRDGVPLNTLFPEEPGQSTWSATVQLWSAGLDVEGFRAVVSAVFQTDGRLAARPSWLGIPSLVELDAAVLRGDSDTARRLRFGHALLDNELHPTLGGTWKDDTMAALLNGAMGFRIPLTPPPASTTEDDMLCVARAAWGVLGINTVRWDQGGVEEFILWLLDLPLPDGAQMQALALAARPFDDLLRTIQTKPGDWSPKTIALLARAVGVRTANTSLVRDYLNTVLPVRWELGFID